MTYLLIVFIILVALAPVVWMKSSPKQQKVAHFRLMASRQGLVVSLSKAPDARKEDNYLNYVSYTLPWSHQQSGGTCPKLEFLLVKESRRGDPSVWPKWNWLTRDADVRWHQPIGDCLKALSEDVSGLKVDNNAITFFWQEQADEQGLNGNITALKTLQTQLYLIK